MKLAGDQLLFGSGTLAHLKTLDAKKVVIVVSSERIRKSEQWPLLVTPLEEAGIPYSVFVGVEPDPSFSTVRKGAEFFLREKPDFILAVGGGSVMDAAKTMWVLYEHPEINSLAPLMSKEGFPKLRGKARFGCIPTTSGSASEVSRSVVITDDDGVKCGIGNMEMMPDLAICDPVLTESLPPDMTAATGMDALTHAVEAYASTRANYVSEILAKQAILDVFRALPSAYTDGGDPEARETMMNASMVAGLAFTNVSLGIVHSIAHGCGSLFHLPHGKANAIILPYVIDFNCADERARGLYDGLADALGAGNFGDAVRKLNKSVGIPAALNAVVPEEDFEKGLGTLVDLAMADGCTKTNPIIPSKEQMKELLRTIYSGT